MLELISRQIATALNYVVLSVMSISRRKWLALPLCLGLLGCTADTSMSGLSFLTSGFEYCSEGRDALEAGNYDLAIDHYTRCIAEGESVALIDLAIAYNNRGIAYTEKNDHNRAIKDYDEAIRLDPALTDAYVNLGFSLNMLGRFEEGLEVSEEAIRLAPRDAYGYANKAFALGHLGRYEEALEAAREGVRLEENDAAVWAMMGFAENLVGSYRESVASFEKALELDPDYFKHEHPEQAAQYKAYEASREGRPYTP